MGRMSFYANDEELKNVQKHINCMSCHETFERGGVFIGSDLGLCEKCASRLPKDMNLEVFGYILADAYLDSNVRNHKTPLEFVEPILKELEKILYYSISHGMYFENKQNKKAS